MVHSPNVEGVLGTLPGPAQGHPSLPGMWPETHPDAVKGPPVCLPVLAL